MSQVLIERVSAVIVDLPTIRPHTLAMHTLHQQTLVVIRVQCSDAIEGIGESTTSVAWPMATKARRASSRTSIVIWPRCW